MIVSPILINNKKVYPLIDGGKGIGFTDGASAGLWAKEGGVGTFSAAAANYYDENGNIAVYSFSSLARKDRHDQLIEQEIKGAIAQAERAYNYSDGKGLINLNILWEMGGTKRILEGSLPKASCYLNAITAGAGLPYDLAPIAARFNLGFIPIVSSERAMRVLWLKSYHKYAPYLQAVVYEDPWKAGGHNGLSSKENPLVSEPPKERVQAIRDFLKSVGKGDLPIIMAGNVWHLNEWSDFIDNKDLGNIMFQFGTRTLVTKENPSQLSMKLAFLKAGEQNTKVHLHKFSPTGLYSSALENSFLRTLLARSARQVEFKRAAEDEFDCEFKIGVRNRSIFVKSAEKSNVQMWLDQGYTCGLVTPDKTMVFVDELEAKQILQDQQNCKGCLKGCKFSAWYQEDPYSTGMLPDPRSFCIFNTLYSASHGGDVDNNLMFGGQVVKRFSSDPFYKRGDEYYIPTIKELFDQILTGY